MTDRPMRIAITHHSTFDRVRRGSERFIDEVARFMTARGHEVTVLTCRPGPPEVVRDRGFVTVYHRSWWRPPMARLGLLEHHTFLPTAFRALLRGNFDVVHSMSFTDGFAAGVARKMGGAPNVLTVNGIPHQHRVRSLTLGGAVFKRAVQYASVVLAPSSYVEEYVMERWGRSTVRFPGTVDMDLFRLSHHRDHRRPVILCTAALDEPRKGGPVLMRAFNLVKERCPAAILHLAHVAGEESRRNLIELVSPQYRADVHFDDVASQDLPELYGRAAVTVLSSYGEVFGMVLLESLSTGTPVVGTRHGGIPDMVGCDSVGRLFEPGPAEDGGPSNFASLAQAVLETLELSRCEKTAERCRQHVVKYSWPVLGEFLEGVYRRLVEERRSRNG